MAALVMRDFPLCEAISAAASPRIREGAPHDLSKLAWSFARMSFSNFPLLDAIAV
jgi:hypothetical protein